VSQSMVLEPADAISDVCRLSLLYGKDIFVSERTIYWMQSIFLFSKTADDLYITIFPLQ